MTPVTEACRRCDQRIPMGASHVCRGYPELGAETQVVAEVNRPSADGSDHPLMGQVVQVLEEECPICGGRLGVARRSLAGILRRVGRCDHCRLDFNAEVEQNGGHGCWRLMVVERGQG